MTRGRERLQQVLIGVRVDLGTGVEDETRGGFARRGKGEAQVRNVDTLGRPFAVSFTV